MSNQRETIIAHIVTVLEEIEETSYNTTPHVQRGTEDWGQTENFPALFVDEGEPEPSETFCFGYFLSALNLRIIGRVKGTVTELNQLLEDVRKILLSSTNTYVDDTEIVSVETKQDADSNLKEFALAVRIDYRWAEGAA